MHDECSKPSESRGCTHQTNMPTSVSTISQYDCFYTHFSMMRIATVTLPVTEITHQGG